MRLVNYEVRKTDGTVFTTTKYTEATKCGNRIQKTFFFFFYYLLLKLLDELFYF